MAKKTKTTSAGRRPQGPAAPRRVGVRVPVQGPTTAPGDLAAAVAAAPEGVPATELATAAATLGEPLADEPPADAARPSSSLPTRRVGRLGGATPGRQKAGRPTSTAATITANLDPDDASIPLTTVPYAVADLRRVGVIAAMMLVLIVIAAVIVNVAVK